MKELREKIRGLPGDAPVTSDFTRGILRESHLLCTAADLKALERKYEAAVKALGYYADVRSWTAGRYQGMSDNLDYQLVNDERNGYDIAREALEAE